MARQAAQEESPERTLQLFREALGNIAIATQTLVPQYETATKDAFSWHRVAQKALSQQREDLARAALHRKVAAKQEAIALKAQLNQLSDLQLSLEQNRSLAQSRLV